VVLGSGTHTFTTTSKSGTSGTNVSWYGEFSPAILGTVFEAPSSITFDRVGGGSTGNFTFSGNTLYATPNNTVIGTAFNTNPPGHTVTFQHNGGLPGASGGELKFDYGTASISVVKDIGTARTWTFSSDGVLTMPDGIAGSDGRIAFNFEGYNWGNIRSHNRQVYIESGEGTTATYSQIAVGLDMSLSSVENITLRTATTDAGDLYNDGTGHNPSFNTWIFGKDGNLTLPGNVIADGLSLQSAPITITITDTGGVWGGAPGTYTRLSGVTPPKWTPANYNPSSDSSITYDGGWYLNTPAFDHPVYVNTGTLFNPSATWDPDVEYGLGSGNPGGAYTYSPFNFASNGQFNLGPAQDQAGTYTDVAIQIDSDTDSYAQVLFQNHNGGTNASTDIVLMNSDSDSFINIIDMGINSNNYDFSDYSVQTPGSGYLFTNGGDLTIGTQTPGKALIFHAGGTTSTDSVGRFDQYGWSFNRQVVVSDRKAGPLVFTNQNISTGSGASAVYQGENDNNSYFQLGILGSNNGGSGANWSPSDVFLTANGSGNTLHIGGQTHLNFYADYRNSNTGIPALAIDRDDQSSTFAGNVLPRTDLTYNLGSTSSQWNKLYLNSIGFADNSTQTTAYTGTVAYSNITGAPASVNKTSGSWILATGANTVSITVAPGGNYQMWVNGNISNGIVEWNATVNVSNPNVPAIGSQYAWYYAAGNALVLTAIPNQIVGTAGVISSATGYTGTTSNVFSFGITNNSVSTQTVYWGYTTL
jgi:hypothetical protein